MSAHVWRKRGNRRERERGPAFTVPGQKGDLTPDFGGRKAVEQRRNRKRDRKGKGWKREKELTFNEISPLTYDTWYTTDIISHVSAYMTLGNKKT